MRVGGGELTFEWIDDWAKLPESESLRRGWAHHGLVVTSSGDLIAFHPGDPLFLQIDPSGNLTRAWETTIAEAHGVTLVEENRTEYLWIADQGAKRAPDAGYQYQTVQRGWQVVKLTLDGTPVQSLERPPLGVYDDARFAPTGVAVNEERDGGNGDIWVTDGYGQSLVHRYSRTGAYRGHLDGSDGAGRFSCPHCLWFDSRKTDPELYVADRSNRRIQVFDGEGRFKRVIGGGLFTSPSGFARLGDYLAVAELRARIAILDPDDRIAAYLGENEAACARAGWPNETSSDGSTVRTSQLRPGKLNSPHGIAADAAGNLYVSEWLIGGRLIKLARV